MRPIDSSRWSAMTRQRGIFVVMPTPFDEQGALSDGDLRRLLKFVLDAGVHGIAHLLDASEASTLTEDEAVRVVRTTVDIVDGMVPTIFGVTRATALQATDAARRYEDLGASCVCSRPPDYRFGRRLTSSEFQDYFGKIGGAVRIPVMIQNTPRDPIAVDDLVDLLKLSNIHYVKEESSMAGHTISEILRLSGGKCRGIFGGAGGVDMPDEHRRGASGSMPGAHIPEAFVHMWERLESGDAEGARVVRSKILPLALMEERFFPRIYKEVLVKRGVISSAVTRVAGTPLLDPCDHLELRTILEDIASLLTPIQRERSSGA
ncbi:MAG: dihydrodipicolinate synthase family protein [Verrucomicrobia bacterium]|nr:dihydrodipicolinate synthase family protein [Verrucomicrobiota bacterium]